MNQSKEFLKNKNQYQKNCDYYMNLFLEKQDFDPFHFFWVNGIVGGIVVIGNNEYIFSFHDIVLDVNSGQKSGEIIKWYNECLSVPQDAKSYFDYTRSKFL